LGQPSALASGAKPLISQPEEGELQAERGEVPGGDPAAGQRDAGDQTAPGGDGDGDGDGGGLGENQLRACDGVGEDQCEDPVFLLAGDAGGGARPCTRWRS
jgi:hypothetical protein